MNRIAVDDRQISVLWPATDEELLSVIGANALPLVTSPGSILQGGRTGEFHYEGSEALGVQFDHPAFKRYAILFLKTWSSQLVDAVCKNSPLADDLKKVTIEKRDIAVGLVVGALTANIPELAAYAGLLTALAIFIVKSGIQAFCETIARAKSGAL
jgi:hypothetical protein